MLEKNRNHLLLLKDPQDRIDYLKSVLLEEPLSDEAYFLLGNAYRKKEMMGEAMNAFIKAIEINPESPAKLAYAMLVEIMKFYHKDRFNQ